VEFPISRLSSHSLDLSFSGLKTAMLYAVRGVPADPRRPDRAPPAPPPLTDARRADLAASFQRAAVGAIILKLRRGQDRVPGARSLLVGGGVSANSLLRSQLAALSDELGLEVRLPRMEYCLDNAAMIAGLAHHVLAARAGRGDDLSLVADPTATC